MNPSPPPPPSPSPSSFDFSRVTTLIFDVDDTLYDVGTGFTAHRNGEGAQSFMVEKLNFPDMESAKVVRDEYFERYHSTAKALTVAEQEGRLPPPAGGDDGAGEGNGGQKKPRFDTKDLAQWWAERLNFSLLGGPNPDVVAMLQSCPLKLVAFSNGPRLYVLRALKEIGLLRDDIFSPDAVFAVDDVLPHCKPEKQAFEKVLSAISLGTGEGEVDKMIDPSECIMVEDSMKNIREAKKLGMGTVLIAGLGRLNKDKDGSQQQEQGQGQSLTLADEAEATKPGDAPDAEDAAVDICIEGVAELQSALPQLWEKKD